MDWKAATRSLIAILGAWSQFGDLAQAQFPQSNAQPDILPSSSPAQPTKDSSPYQQSPYKQRLDARLYQQRSYQWQPNELRRPPGLTVDARTARTGDPTPVVAAPRRARVGTATQSSPPFIGLMGQVTTPGVYRLNKPSTELGELIIQAGGLTRESNGNVRVVRNGRLVHSVYLTPSTKFTLRPGDVLVADGRAARVSGVQEYRPGMSGVRGKSQRDIEPKTVQLALLNLIDRPVIVPIRAEHASVPAILALLDQPAEMVDHVRVVAAGSKSRRETGTAPIQTPAGGWAPKLETGTVLIFDRETVLSDKLPTFPPVIGENDVQTNSAPSRRRDSSGPSTAAPLAKRATSFGVQNRLQRTEDSPEPVRRSATNSKQNPVPQSLPAVQPNSIPPILGTPTTGDELPTAPQITPALPNAKTASAAPLLIGPQLANEEPSSRSSLAAGEITQRTPATSERQSGPATTPRRISDAVARGAIVIGPPSASSRPQDDSRWDTGETDSRTELRPSTSSDGTVVEVTPQLGEPSLIPPGLADTVDPLGTHSTRPGPSLSKSAGHKSARPPAGEPTAPRILDPEAAPRMLPAQKPDNVFSETVPDSSRGLSHLNQSLPQDDDLANVQTADASEAGEESKTLREPRRLPEALIASESQAVQSTTKSGGVGEDSSRDSILADRRKISLRILFGLLIAGTVSFLIALWKFPRFRQLLVDLWKEDGEESTARPQEDGALDTSGEAVIPEPGSSHASPTLPATANIAASRLVSDCSTTDHVVAANSPIAVAKQQSSALIDLMAENRLPIEEEPIHLPAVQELYGKPAAGRIVRLDDGHDVPSPHFGRGAKSDAIRPAPLAATFAAAAAERSSGLEDLVFFPGGVGTEEEDEPNSPRNSTKSRRGALKSAVAQTDVGSHRPTASAGRGASPPAASMSAMTSSQGQSATSSAATKSTTSYKAAPRHSQITSARMGDVVTPKREQNLKGAIVQPPHARFEEDIVRPPSPRGTEVSQPPPPMPSSVSSIAVSEPTDVVTEPKSSATERTSYTPEERREMLKELADRRDSVIDRALKMTREEHQ